MLPGDINIILVKTRFPENIGMAARACANMGCDSICLVNPERWDREKALPLATAKGEPILDRIEVYDDLTSALATRGMVFATSARVGGWRKNPLPPWIAATQIINALHEGEKVSLVFGPEDKGLENWETTICGQLIHIKTCGCASSFNLAQAVLIILYECCRAEQTYTRASESRRSPRINMEELARLECALKESLLLLDCGNAKNPDYFFLQWRNIMDRAGIRRHEYDALMGLCRQIKNKLKIG